MSDNQLTRHGPFQELVGYEVVNDDQYGALVTTKIAEKHLNLNGVPHGGLVMTMLDAIGGRIVKVSQASIESVVTINLLVDFLKPCREGTLIAVGECEQIGKTIAFTNGNQGECEQIGKTIAYVNLKLYLDEIGGTVIAKGSGTYRVFNKSLVSK